jgi:hypothetical protein
MHADTSAPVGEMLMPLRPVTVVATAFQAGRPVIDDAQPGSPGTAARSPLPTASPATPRLQSPAASCASFASPAVQELHLSPLQPAESETHSPLAQIFSDVLAGAPPAALAAAATALEQLTSNAATATPLRKGLYVAVLERRSCMLCTC